MNLKVTPILLIRAKKYSNLKNKLSSRKNSNKSKILLMLISLHVMLRGGGEFSVPAPKSTFIDHKKLRNV